MLMSGLLLTCVALTALSLSFHLTSFALGRRAGAGNTDRPLALQRLVGLYLVSTAVRGFHLRNLGVAYGTDLTAWGSLEPLAQWIGCVEDLRYLALALLVAHVVRRRTVGRLARDVAVRRVDAGSLVGLPPPIMPVVLCIVTAVVFDRLRARYVLLLLMAVAIVATLVPVVRSIRQDQQGVIGTREAASAADALAAPRTHLAWRPVQSRHGAPQILWSSVRGCERHRPGHGAHAGGRALRGVRAIPDAAVGSHP